MTIPTLHIKPAPGLIVRDPATGNPLAAEGENKPDTTYWRRRLRDGDALFASVSEPAPTKGGKSK
ncbi:MAG TPA: hypothetical protein DC063_00265 [Arenimonas sp.]|nr:hypothetical protein [Arenimonas sp.]